MTLNIEDYGTKFKFLKKLTLIVLVSSIILSLPALCGSHDAYESPSFKYSRQANENFDAKEVKAHHQHNDHGHGHHHHHHDHEHEHHHHAHDHDRGHVHDHVQDHAHDHAHDDDHDHDHYNPDAGHYYGHETDHGDDYHYHGYQDNHHHHHNQGDHGSEKREAKGSLDMQSIWINSIGSTLLISAAPFLLLYVIPLDNSEAMKPRLKVLLAFASGGLLGDAFLHLIPHAAHPHSHHGSDHHHGHHHHDHDERIFIHQVDDPSEHPDHSHPHGHGHNHDHGHDMTIGLWVLGGIIAFLSVEKIVRLLKGSSGHGHSHGHDKNGSKSKSVKKTTKKNEEKEEKKSPKPKGKGNKDTKETKEETEDENKKEIKEKGKAVNKKEEHQEEDQVEIAGYLNLAADFAHNFTDGLAIGASYLAGNSIGIVTTITILLHEVPHEIGDFAILIKSGCSRRKAMLLQLVTALGAVAGTALALLGVSGDNESAPWVLPFTAGGFIYIATVSVLPELLEESTKLVQSIKEIVALLTGVGLMIVIAKFE